MHCLDDQTSITDTEVATSGTITQLLTDWRGGDSEALERLTPLVYPQLRKIAAVRLRSDSAAQTLQPTALVHEAYIRMAGSNPPDLENRAHFFGVAGRLMNQILIQNARSRNAGKRGDGVRPVCLDEADPGTGNSTDAFEVEEALEALSSEDPRKASIVELRYFYGMTVDEIAAELQISTSTVERDMRIAVAWLHRYMTSPNV